SRGSDTQLGLKFGPQTPSWNRTERSTTTARCSLLRYKPDSSCTRGAVSLTCNLVPASGPNLQLVESWTANSFLPTKDTGRRSWATAENSAVKAEGQLEEGEQGGVEEHRAVAGPLPSQGEHMDAEGPVAPFRVTQVHAVGGLAVGGGRHQAQIAGAPGRALDPDQPLDVLGALHPGGERRHLEGRLGSEQIGERADVVVLECGDVAVQEFALFDGGHPNVFLPRQALAESGSGALQKTVDGRDRGVEHLGDLGGAETQDFTQDQHGALLGR